MPEQYKEIGLNQGLNIKAIREDILGESQETLAERALTYQQHISRMENKSKLSEQEKIKLADALGVDVKDIEYFDKEKALIKVYKDNNPTAHDHSELLFGDILYKIINPLGKVSELYERLNKADKYIMYLETLLEANNINFSEKKKQIFDSK